MIGIIDHENHFYSFFHVLQKYREQNIVSSTKTKLIFKSCKENDLEKKFFQPLDYLSAIV